VLPVKPVTNTEPFKGKFPERDFSGASLMQHCVAALLVANQLLMAAVKIWESDPDSPYVLGLTLNALAFISDAVGHAHIAGGDPSAIDGNVLQKGHATTQAMFLLLGVAGNLGVIGEKKYAGFALEKVPDLGKRTLGARVVTNPMFIIPLNLWQTAHGAGVFGSA